jgi:hypothetical protein
MTAQPTALLPLFALAMVIRARRAPTRTAATASRRGLFDVACAFGLGEVSA